MSKEQLDEFIVWLTTEVIEKNKDLSDDYGQGQATAFTQVIDYLRTVPKLQLTFNCNPVKIVFESRGIICLKFLRSPNPLDF